MRLGQIFQRALSGAAGALLVGAVCAQAQEAKLPWPVELRIAALDHGLTRFERRGFDLGGEVIIDAFGRGTKTNARWYVPRLAAGGMLAFGHNQTSQAYAGVNWRVNLIEAWFVEGFFGGALHDGSTGNVVPFERSNMGCRVVFHESAALGYQVNDKWSVMAVVDHSSNAGLCTKNGGLTTAGVKIGYSF